MTDETLEFLQECKKAGYERVTIFIADERLPISVKIRKDNTGLELDDDGINSKGQYCPKNGRMSHYWGHGTDSFPFKVVCASPERKGPHPQYRHKDKWPAIWGIVKRLDLNHYGGGNLDGHDIGAHAVPLLDAGYYVLSEIKE